MEDVSETTFEVSYNSRNKRLEYNVTVSLGMSCVLSKQRGYLMTHGKFSRVQTKVT